MTRTSKSGSSRRRVRSPQRQREEPLPEPVDVVDGIPDRSRRPATWKYVLLILLFAGWICLLVIFLVAGAL